MQIRILIWAAGGVGIILVPPPLNTHLRSFLPQNKLSVK